MKYLKLFENFEENKTPKSITVKITDEGIKRLGLKNNVGKVTLYPEANQWLRIGDTTAMQAAAQQHLIQMT